MKFNLQHYWSQTWKHNKRRCFPCLLGLNGTLGQTSAVGCYKDTGTPSTTSGCGVVCPPLELCCQRTNQNIVSPLYSMKLLLSSYTPKTHYTLKFYKRYKMFFLISPIPCIEIRKIPPKNVKNGRRFS